MKKLSIIFLLVLILLSLTKDLTAQAGSYYDALDVNSSSFITDLQTRIRSPYTRIAYAQFDETNIANFASVNNGDGTKSVFCVYTNYEYVYTGTFAWVVLSREHTYCHSWMPSYPSESTDEYADQYHLFPTHQNNANGRRSNHPLGIVTTVTYQFMEGKLGKNDLNQTVYEPRFEQKGDAARALLYMSVKYNGLNGNNWTFGYLNNTRLPALSEAPQDLDLLIAWHKLDPPTKREIERTNYVQTIQKNRNPFIDHPEYVNYIDFNSISKLNPVYATEPTNHITNLISNVDANSITLSWVNSVGAQIPTGYLIIAYDRDDYFLPIDGEVYSDDTDLSDGKAIVNVSSTNTSYTFNYLVNLEEYYFTVIPFSGSENQINYKINGTLPRVLSVQALPVELVSFNATNNENSVTLNWSTASEENNHGFEIERRLSDDVNNWDKIGFVAGTGTTTETQNYSYVDNISLPGRYTYRLKQIDFDGGFVYSSEISVLIGRPVNFKLNQNYPNPFNPSTKISFSLPEESKVVLRVFNVLGQSITTLVNEKLSAGNYEKDFDASELESGVYFYRLETDNFVETKKMILLY